MNFIPALSGMLPWLILAGVPLGIVLLYFLKLRREPVEVPSTYLWSRTIEDLHVNSLMQRLRNSLLLFLQLLLVVLAALALFRPGVRDEASSLGRLVFLLDTSASMQAPHGDSDLTKRSRFEFAKEQIEVRVNAMTDSETAMLVTFSDRAEVLQAFTSDRNRLRDALSRALVTNQPTDILGALNAADGLANPRRTSEQGTVDVQVADAQPAELHLYSDGGFQQVTEFSLGNLQPTYHAMGSSESENLAIVSFSAERDLKDPLTVQVFATVLNAGTVPAAADVSLFVDDQLTDAASVDLKPEEQSGLSFEIETQSAVQLRLKLDIEDDLSLDNQAYAALTPSGLVSVLVVTPGNRPLELGLTTDKMQRVAECEFVSPDYLKLPAYEKRAAAGTDDLIIFDRCSPEKMPATNTFSIAALPNSSWTWTSPPGSLTLIDLDRTHPVLRYLELYSLLIFSGRGISGPAGTVNLVESDIGTVLALTSREGFQDLVLGYELVSEDAEGTQANTNWYAERSWPVFLLNVLRHLGGAAQSSGAPSYAPGDTVMSRLENATREVELRRHAGVEVESLGGLPIAAGGLVEVTETTEPGNYQLIGQPSGRVVDQFVVNLFDPTESHLPVRPDVELGFETVAAVDSGIEIRREYWRPLLIAALLLLGIEWWVYTRRLA